MSINVVLYPLFIRIRAGSFKRVIERVITDVLAKLLLFPAFVLAVKLATIKKSFKWQGELLQCTVFFTRVLPGFPKMSYTKVPTSDPYPSTASW